jgi:hypothetical protein
MIRGIGARPSHPPRGSSEAGHMVQLRKCCKCEERPFVHDHADPPAKRPLRNSRRDRFKAFRAASPWRRLRQSRKDGTASVQCIFRHLGPGAQVHTTEQIPPLPTDHQVAGCQADGDNPDQVPPRIEHRRPSSAIPTSGALYPVTVVAGPALHSLGTSRQSSWNRCTRRRKRPDSRRTGKASPGVSSPPDHRIPGARPATPPVKLHLPSATSAAGREGAFFRAT